MVAFCDARAHNFSIAPVHLMSYEQGMVLCMVYRQCLTVIQRSGQSASWVVPEWARSFKIDAFHGRTVHDIVTQNDFEEPIPWNSAWLVSRRAVAESLAVAGNAKAIFLARMLICHTGSSELMKIWQASEMDGSMPEQQLQVLRRRFALIVSDPTKEIWEFFVGRELNVNLFHNRFRPVLIYRNAMSSPRLHDLARSL